MSISRRAIIEEIEHLRGSRVLAYVTGDRGSLPAFIGPDAVPPIFDELDKMGDVGKIDLFLCSRGGALEVPWRIASALRSVADWDVLIPNRADGAATLLALGADHMLFGRGGSLETIDAILDRAHPELGLQPRSSIVDDPVGVRTLTSYMDFISRALELKDPLEAVRKGAAISGGGVDEAALLTAWLTQCHIADEARRMLLSRKSPPAEPELARILHRLAEDGDPAGIFQQEAEEIGLPACHADDVLEDLMARLMKEYVQDLDLRNPVDPAFLTEENDLYREQATVAVVESTAGAHELTGQLHIRAKRNPPPRVRSEVSVNVQLPAGVKESDLPDRTRKLLRDFRQQAEQLTKQELRDAVQKYAYVTGYDVSLRGARWAYTDYAEA